MKDKYEGCYIDGYKDHYAVFADNGEKLAEYDTHKEAKEDIAEWEAEVKNESYIPADTLATGYRFTIHETELLENAIKKHVEQKVDQGVNAMFDTDSEEFKKVGNKPYDKSQWWDDMKLTMRIKKTPFPRKNGYTNGDFRPNQKWLMGAIECCKSARDCEYLLKDAYLSVAHDKKLIQNLKSVRDGNPNKYVNVKVVQKWLDNGVTPEKVEKHIEWFKANYIKGLQAKKKEFNKAQNENVTEEPINELGIFTAINIGFWGFVGICCIVSGILDKKHGKEIKANLTDAEFKAIKNDTITVAKNLIAAQKSSPFYNSIYKHNWITQDTYKDMINSFNKGDLCSSTVRFFDAENFENYKSYYKEYGEWGDYNPNWEKLEKSVNADMVKIIESLGFDIKTGKSPKYPNCEVRVADGEVVYVYPKAPDDILERGKKSKKKLNEDHSEISNDPEMEELMALAGVTTADLDDLENDNDLDLDEDDPIDANTLREIDAAMDESVGGVIAISVAGLIGGAAIVNAITERKLKAETKELTKAEFDKLINDMVSINEAVISKLKTSKWWKFIYEPCMNRKNSPDIHNQASKYKQEFMSGKCIGPSFHSSFVDIDDPDPKIYTKLDAEIGKSSDDEAWEKAFDSAYYESQKLIKEAVKKLGFNDEGKSTKYPDIKIDIGSGEYIGIWIEPIYNGYYKLKDAKKSQNESVDTNLDILLAESAEFLFDE